jgi:hypothetical protein
MFVCVYCGYEYRGGGGGGVVWGLECMFAGEWVWVLVEKRLYVLRCCGRGSEESMFSLVHGCKILSDKNVHQCTILHSHSSEPQPQHPVPNTTRGSTIRIQPNTPDDGHIYARNV